jgi:RNA ligase (TIGR02306 family)
MSTHEVLVVEIEQVVKHPNADALEIVKVSGYDYSIVSKLGDFVVGDKGIFVEPDYVVPTTSPVFSFLKRENKDKERITVRRLRGVWSEGLLIKAEPYHKVGDNVMEEYGITRWEPPPQKSFGWGAEGAALKSGLQAKEPVIPGIHRIPKYDLENIKKYTKVISTDDEVYYTCKLHGCSARYVCWDGEMHCGSRTTWKKKTEGEKISFVHPLTNELIERDAPSCSWWDALKSNPWIEEWCKANPGIILYGELFGPTVQGNKFHYGIKSDEFGFRVFDVLTTQGWVSFSDLVSKEEYKGLKLVPVLYHGKHNPELLEKLAEEPETSLDGCGGNHIREGIVIKPTIEKYDLEIGRVALKYVSRTYLMKS